MKMMKMTMLEELFTDCILGIANIFGIMIKFCKIYCYGIVGIINTFRGIIGKTQRPGLSVIINNDHEKVLII